MPNWIWRRTHPEPTAATLPMVSCIMPTYNRRPFVAQAIRYFHQQDYPRKELIIVDDGTDEVRDLTVSDAQISYLQLPQRTTLGEKRNLAIAASNGTLIAHWDDDDWYAPGRLTYQLAPLITGAADLTALRMSFMYDLDQNLIWFVDRELHQEMFFCGIHTGTLAYHKWLWNPVNAFPAVDLAEDVAFIRAVVGQGAQLLRLPNDLLFAPLQPVDVAGALPFLEDLVRRSGGALYPPRRPACLYVRHATNTWRFVCGEHLNPQAWHKLAPDDLLPGADLAYYRRLAAAAHSSRGHGARTDEA